jgi:hypothetical protein
MQRKAMEFATLWLPIIGGLLLGALAVGAWYGGNKTLAIWSGFAGIVCFLLLAALQMQEVVSNEEASSAGGHDPAFRLDQRAWLGVDYIRPVPLRPEVGKPFQVIVRLKNTGKTPARNIIGTALAEPTANERPSYDYAGRKQFRRGVIASNAGGDIPINLSRSPNTGEVVPLTQETFDGLSRGDIKIFAHGKVDYEDIFGIPHWFTFCGKLNVPFDGHFGACADHNDIDANK